MPKNGIDSLIKHYFHKHRKIEFVCISMRNDRVQGVLVCAWELIIAQATLFVTFNKPTCP